MCAVSLDNNDYSLDIFYDFFILSFINLWFKVIPKLIKHQNFKKQTIS